MPVSLKDYPKLVAWIGHRIMTYYISEVNRWS